VPWRSIKKVCEQCGKRFGAKTPYTRFCSRLCARASTRGVRRKPRPKPRSCLYCSTPFTPKWNTKRQRKYCSIKCALLHRNKTWLASRVSKRMRKDNPMKRPEVVRKVVRTGRRLGYHKEFGRRTKRLWREGKIRHTPLSRKARKAAAKRMRDDNPMFNPKIAAKAHRHRKYKRGKRSNLSRFLWSKPGSHEKHSRKMRRRNPMKRRSVAKRVSISMKKKWATDAAFAKKAMKARLAVHNGVPNGHERVIGRFIRSLGYPFKWCGSGSVIISGKGKGHYHIPDWIWKSQGLVILYHGTYWHRNDKKRKCNGSTCYKRAGYRVLVLWTKDAILHDYHNRRVGERDIRILIVNEKKLTRMVTRFVEQS